MWHLGQQDWLEWGAERSLCLPCSSFLFSSHASHPPEPEPIHLTHLSFCPTVSPSSHLVSCLLVEMWTDHMRWLSLLDTLFSPCLPSGSSSSSYCVCEAVYMCMNLCVGEVGRGKSYGQRGRQGQGVSCSVIHWLLLMHLIPPSFSIPCFIPH